MSLDYLCDLLELEKLRAEYRASPHTQPGVVANRIATRMLMADPDYNHMGTDWLGSWQLKRRQRIERPASPEHFAVLEMVGAVRDTYFLSGGYSPPRTQKLLRCPVVGCESRQRSNGLCNLHNMSKTRHPHLWCSVRGCGKRLKDDPRPRRGMCNAHVLKARHYGDPTHVERVRTGPKSLCSIEDCERTSYCRGWCKPHYQRWQRTGNPLGREARKEAAA